MIKGIIFDVDDTLIQFSRIATPIHIKVAKQLKLKVPKASTINRLWGLPWEILAKKLWPNENHERIRKIIFKLYKKQKFEQFPGTTSVLKNLKNRYILGILSSKPKPTLKYQLKKANISLNYFKLMYAAEDTKYDKPDPRVFAKPLKKLKSINKGIKRSEILYIGDSIYDCIASKKAKLKFVAVLTGHYKKSEFLKKGIKSKYVVKSLKEVPRLLKDGL